MITPDYYDRFRCIGGACKNSCCADGWDIEIDDETKTEYDAIKSEFGDRLRESIDSDNVFKRKNGKCLLFNKDGLCDILINGHNLCTTCHEYPRFTEYYGDYCERGIALSCEAATKIILDNTSKVTLTGEMGECDEEIFEFLYNSRKCIFDILQDRTTSISKRIRLVLDYGEKLQEKIANNDYTEFIYSPRDRFAGLIGNASVFEFLNDLDYLSEDWADVLDAHDNYAVQSEIQIEQLAIYFVYRYFLKATFDCDALSKLKFMAISVIAIASLRGDIYDNIRRYSIEVEHNEDNVEMIYDEFLFNSDFSTENIINMISA